MRTDINDDLTQITINMSKEEILLLAQRLIQMAITDDRVNDQVETGGVWLAPQPEMLVSERTRAHGVPLTYMINMSPPLPKRS